MAYTTFPNEKVLVQSNGCTLVECDALHRPGRQYVAVTRDGFRTDYPHWNGTYVGWDNPEWFPVTFREKAGRAIFDARNEFKAFNDAAWAAKHLPQESASPAIAPVPVVASLVTAQIEPEPVAKKAGGSDDVYIYQADTYCENCASKIQEKLNAEGVEDDRESDTYPQGPYSDEESDTPEHCAVCHTFLHNPLTQAGYDYVREQAAEKAENPVVKEWLDYYGGDTDINGVPMTASAKQADEESSEIRTAHGTMHYRSSDVVNPDDYIPTGEFNPHKVRPWLIHNEFGTVAIVYADYEQCALDEAVDAGKLDSDQVSDEDLATMSEEEKEDLLTAGNAGEYLHQDYLGILELPNQQYGKPTTEDSMDDRAEGEEPSGDHGAKSSSAKTATKFNFGDRVRCSFTDPYSGVREGDEGTVSVVSGLRGKSVHPDPLKRLLMVKWDSGETKSVPTGNVELISKGTGPKKIKPVSLLQNGKLVGTFATTDEAYAAAPQPWRKAYAQGFSIKQMTHAEEEKAKYGSATHQYFFEKSGPGEWTVYKSSPSGSKGDYKGAYSSKAQAQAAIDKLYAKEEGTEKTAGVDISALDSFTQAYIEAALWSSTDDSDEDTGGEPLDKNYGISDFAPQTLAAMKDNCEKFQAEYGTFLQDDNLVYQSRYSADQIGGHDFWLTQNGHGAGFWDGNWKDEADEALTAGSKKFREMELYVGDDGLIYASGYETYGGGN
jgi:hypothetical protein